MKRIVIILYLVVVVVLAAATIVEKYHGTSYVADNIYGAWWFSALWAMLVAVAAFYFIKRKVRRPSVVALHLSFVIILAGALLTHLTSVRGMVHLRQGEPTTRYITKDMRVHQLPFAVTLERFEIKYYEGTQAPADYLSYVTLDNLPATISMNHIATHRGCRFIQSSYDEDLQGSILAMNSDPWGIPVTYAGYALLFVSLVWILMDPRGSFRQLLRRASAVAVLCVFGVVVQAASPAPRVLPAETAEQFGRLFIVYNDRVCPVQTFALDFTKKLYGSRHYGRYTAEQVLTGFIFYYDDWVNEPLKQDKKPMKMQEKQMLITQLHQGTLLKLFPYEADGQITWYAPTGTLPATMDAEHQKYIRDVFTRLNGEVQAARFGVADQYISRMHLYQRTFGRGSLPSALRIRAERIYNKVPFATILFMACLTLGFVLFFIGIIRPKALSEPSRSHSHFPFRSLFRSALFLALCALTICLVLRCIVTGTVPMSNGYETMLVLAWCIMLLALLMSRRFPLMLTFGFLLSGFLLLVSHISQMDPQMTPLMPVLNSPLLTIHVSVIMMAYALLSLTFVSSLTALLVRSKVEEMTLLSQLMLYPALTFLGFGIFIGAIWANLSWGTYWSWDPKETWALITFMIYAAPAHTSFKPHFHSPSHFSISSPQRVEPERGLSPFFYHLYMTFAFLSILMTYFGVNYILGGMHSYA